MLDNLTSQDFVPYLNQQFRIHAGSALDAELIEVSAVESAERQGGASKRLAFSIVFRCSMDVVLEQRIYKIEHAAMGAMDVFLVPIGPDHVGMRYEALFG
jgi:hypothetical protein